MADDDSTLDADAAKGPRITEETLRTLAVVADMGQATPTDVGRRSGLAKGTVSATLKRLVDAGWLSSRREGGDPHTLGRPLRVFYQVADEALVRRELQSLYEAFDKLWAALA